MKKSICKLIYVLSFITFIGVSLQAQPRLFLQVENACTHHKFDVNGNLVEDVDNVFLTATPAGMTDQPGLLYTWDFGDGSLPETTQVSEIAHPYKSANGNKFFAKVSVDYNGTVVESVSREVVLHNAPSVVFSFDSELVTGCEGGSPLEFSAETNDADAHILWNNTESSFNRVVTSSKIGLNSPKTISAIVYKEYEDGKICTIESEYGQAMIVSKPVIQASSNFGSIYVNQTANLSASTSSSIPATSYKWTPAVELTNANGSNPVFTPMGIGPKEFMVTGSFVTTNNDVCAGTASVSILVEQEIGGDMTTPIVSNKVLVPESSYNQFWTIEQAAWYAGARLTIFNKWGQEVCKKDIGADNNVWNGKSDDNKELPSDAYYYIISGKYNGQDVTHTGSISILHK
jgi:gliding motility-associated-like protein